MRFGIRRLKAERLARTLDRVGYRLNSLRRFETLPSRAGATVGGGQTRGAASDEARVCFLRMRQ